MLLTVVTCWDWDWWCWCAADAWLLMLAAVELFGPGVAIAAAAETEGGLEADWRRLQTRWRLTGGGFTPARPRCWRPRSTLDASEC